MPERKLTVDNVGTTGICLHGQFLTESAEDTRQFGILRSTDYRFGCLEKLWSGSLFLLFLRPSMVEQNCWL